MIISVIVAVIALIAASFLLWYFVCGRREMIEDKSIMEKAHSGLIISFIICLLIESVVTADIYMALRYLSRFGDADQIRTLLIPVSPIVSIFLLIPSVVMSTKKESRIPENHDLLKSFLMIALLDLICLAILWGKDGPISSAAYLILGILSTVIAVCTPYVSRDRYNIDLQKIDNKLSSATRAHYEAVKESNFEMRRVRHDMKNHLLVIRDLADRSRTDDSSREELVSYVDSILSDIESASPPYRTGNDIADVMIADKSGKARKRGFELAVSGDIAGVTVDSADLVTILSNLLDNAVEAVSRLYGRELTEDQKKIELEFRKNTNFLYIIERNISGSVIDQSLIRSSKNSPDHGFGIYNIRKVVKKYGGEFNLNCSSADNGLYMVEAEIMIPIRDQ